MRIFAMVGSCVRRSRLALPPRASVPAGSAQTIGAAPPDACGKPERPRRRATDRYRTLRLAGPRRPREPPSLSVTSVLIVDDHALMRSGIRRLLEDADGF